MMARIPPPLSLSLFSLLLLPPPPLLDLNERANTQKLISVLLRHLLLVAAFATCCKSQVIPGGVTMLMDFVCFVYLFSLSLCEGILLLLFACGYGVGVGVELR